MDQWNLETIKSRFACFGENFDWGLLTNAEEDFFKNEFVKEIQKDHSLYNIGCKAIARRYSKDDVLFVLENCNWVILHLTYSADNLYGWPIFESFENCDSALDYIEKQYNIEFF